MLLREDLGRHNDETNGVLAKVLGYQGGSSYNVCLPTASGNNQEYVSPLAEVEGMGELELSQLRYAVLLAQKSVEEFMRDDVVVHGFS